MNMQFIKQIKFSTCAFITTAVILSACSGGGGETSLNGNINTTDVSPASIPSSTSTDTTAATTETSPAVTGNVATSEIAGYITVPSGFRAGQTATIEGHGYKPQSAYSLTIRDPAGGISTQSVNVGANGDFQFQLNLPQAGLYTATAVDNGTGTEVGEVIVSAASEDF